MAGDTEDWKGSTSIEPRDAGWISYSCGHDMRQRDRPNVSSYVNGKCPVCKSREKQKCEG